MQVQTVVSQDDDCHHAYTHTVGSPWIWTALLLCYLILRIEADLLWVVVTSVCSINVAKYFSNLDWKLTSTVHMHTLFVLNTCTLHDIVYLYICTVCYVYLTCTVSVLATYMSTCIIWHLICCFLWCVTVHHLSWSFWLPCTLIKTPVMPMLGTQANTHSNYMCISAQWLSTLSSW